MQVFIRLYRIYRPLAYSVMLKRHAEIFERERLRAVARKQLYKPYRFVYYEFLVYLDCPPYVFVLVNRLPDLAAVAAGTGFFKPATNCVSSLAICS